jgi:hypothetical protein
MLKRLFPEMNDRPAKWMSAPIFGYWILAFACIPVWLPLITTGLWGTAEFNSWVDVVYHTVNAAVVVWMLKGYAIESFLEVQLDPKKFFTTVGIGALLMLAFAGELWMLLGAGLWEVFPMQPMSIATAPIVMVNELPVIGTLCNAVLVPISVVGLLYVSCFAPMCCRKTWLGYLIIPLMALAPVIFEVLWRGLSDYVIPTYILQLPMHFIACWTYQKADTVWAPLATLAIFNLITSLLCLLPV